MKEPKIEFKNVKTFRGMEGYGINADIFINGVKCLFMMDDANGGEYRYDVIRGKNPEEVQANIKQVDDYIASLPPEKPEGMNMTIKVDRDIYFNNKLVEFEEQKAKEKAAKKMEKLFDTAVVFGVPDGKSYQYLNFKRSLSDVPLIDLQKAVTSISQKYCKDGVVIFNTNLKWMGIRW